jgi:hypothetical protein
MSALYDEAFGVWQLPKRSVSRSLGHAPLYARRDARSATDGAAATPASGAAGSSFSFPSTGTRIVIAFAGQIYASKDYREPKRRILIDKVEGGCVFHNTIVDLNGNREEGKKAFSRLRNGELNHRMWRFVSESLETWRDAGYP